MKDKELIIDKNIYRPLEVVKCKKCGKIIAEPKELIRITKSNIINS
jgi:ribosomal protein S27E